MRKMTIRLVSVAVLVATVFLAVPAPDASAVDVCGNLRGWSDWQTIDLSWSRVRNYYFVPYSVGTHYIQFRGVRTVAYPWIRMTPHWTTSGNLVSGPWNGWGPYYSWQGESVRVTLRTGSLKVRYKFTFERLSSAIASKVEVRTYCGY